MKTQCLFTLGFIILHSSLILSAHAQGTVFTYQGRLNDGAALAGGIYDLRFKIFDSSGGPTVIAGPFTNSATGVSNGLFTATLDPGAGVFTGAERWLEIALRTNGGGAFIPLSPRQSLTPTPYAIMAANVPDFSITADKLAPGAVGSAQLAVGAVQAGNIAPGAVTAAQLAKPPRSGTLLSLSLSPAFDRAAFSVFFSPPLVSTPVVTLGLQGSGTAAHASLYLRNASASRFVGQWAPDNLPGPQVVDSATGAGQFSSLEMVNGRPAVCYYRSPQLLYAHATDALGNSWGTPVSLDIASVGGTILRVINGNPAVCYYDASQGDLRYVRANDADGTTWGAPVAVDTNGNVGRWLAMEVVNGHPAISYYDADQMDLKYVRAADPNGGSWGIPQRVDTNGSVGQYTSLAVVNGQPAISYRSDFPFQLSFVRALDAEGSSWGNPIFPDPNTGGAATSLAVVDGRPAICHYSSSGAELRYVRAGDASGVTWGTAVLVDSGLGLDHTSMRVIGGHPAISYAGGEVRYMRAADTAGIVWGASVEVASASSDYRATLAEVGGQPVIAYYDSFQMKFLRQQSATIPSFTINWIALEP